MSLPNHGAQALIIQYGICNYFGANIHVTLWTVLIAVILGIYPDAKRLFQKNTNDWSGYNELHKLTLANLLIPYFDLHIIEDYFIHDKDGKWKSWVMPVEIISDVFFLIIILKILL